MRIHQLMMAALGAMLILLVSTIPAAAQTLYGMEFMGGTVFAEIDRTTGADITTIGNAAALDDSKGMAMDPTTGTMYVINNDGDAFSLYTISLLDATTAFVGPIDDGGLLTPLVRDITFDSSGQLWGVTGRFGGNANSVLPIDKATGMSGSVLATPLGDRQQAIAYRPSDGLLYVYSSSGTTGPRFFQSIDPMSGTSTPISLSGTGPTVRIKGMVFDPISDVFRLFDDNGNFFTLSVSGVQTDTGNDNATIYMGLAFDPMTTVPVELMGLSIE